MTEFLEFATKLSGAGMATVLLLIIYLGLKKVWVFGYQLVDCEARSATLLRESRDRELEWKAIAREGVSAAKVGVELAKDRTP